MVLTTACNGREETHVPRRGLQRSKRPVHRSVHAWEPGNSVLMGTESCNPCGFGSIHLHTPSIRSGERRSLTAHCMPYRPGGVADLTPLQDFKARP